MAKAAAGACSPLPARYRLDPPMHHAQLLYPAGFAGCWLGYDLSLPARVHRCTGASYTHSGRLSRLFGCSPSLVVFRYLLPNRLVATITSAVLP